MPEAPSELIHLRDVRRRLGVSGGKTVEFALADFRVEPRQRIALTGPSGCGKSTLLNIVSGLARPDSGEVRILGTDVARLAPGTADRFRGRHIGFVYQSFNLLEPFSALENVVLGMRFGGTIPRHDRAPRARHLLEGVGLGHRLHSRPARLSVGERQRVAIARAVAGRPEILLADEPTGALDPATADAVFQLLLSVCEGEGCTLLLVTHDLELASRLPTQVDCRGYVTAGGNP